MRTNPPENINESIRHDHGWTMYTYVTFHGRGLPVFDYISPGTHCNLITARIKRLDYVGDDRGMDKSDF